MLSEITKKEITRVLETTPRIKAKQIRKDLNKRGYIIRGKEAKLRVKELVARYRKKKKKVARIGTTKSEWMEFINKIGPIDLNRLDKPYVVDMKWPEELVLGDVRESSVDIRHSYRCWFTTRVRNS